MSCVIASPQDLFDSTHFAMSPRRRCQTQPILAPGSLFDLPQPPPRRPMPIPLRHRVDAILRPEEDPERWDGLY
ncbi:MAG: hypothetical protein ABSB42_22815 [Tepidisphaeraceae bacterium]|jgi:hypothetical protein